MFFLQCSERWSVFGKVTPDIILDPKGLAKTNAGTNFGV